MAYEMAVVACEMEGTGAVEVDAVETAVGT